MEEALTMELLLATFFGHTFHQRYENEELCVICMEEMKGTYCCTTKCGHTLHWKCARDGYFKYHSTKCLNCATPIEKVTPWK